MKKLLFSAVMATALVGSPVYAEDQAERRILPNQEDMEALGALAEQLLREFADEVSPMAESLKALIDDLDSYQAPEILPNGDIIIRRRPDAPPLPETEGDEGSVAL